MHVAAHSEAELQRRRAQRSAENDVVRDAELTALDDLTLLLPALPREMCLQMLEQCEYDVDAAACDT